MSQSITSIGLILVCLQVSYLVVAQRRPCEPEFGLTESEACGQRYQYRACQDEEWVQAMCVGGFINDTLRQCQPSSVVCPPDTLAAKRPRHKRHAEVDSEEESLLLRRQKRQANRGGNCDRTFQCPTDITSIFIYPDWSNPDCDTFVECENGVSRVVSCSEYGLRYYNPRLLSCENTITETNTCVHRLNTNLSPIFG